MIPGTYPELIFRNLLLIIYVEKRQTNQQAMATTKCSHSHSGWTAETVIWNMKEFLHFILVHLSAGTIMSRRRE